MQFTRRRFVQAMALASLGASLPARAQAGPIRLGLMTVKTGPLASGGIDMERALAQYLKERNSTMAGRKVELLVGDSGGVPAQSRTKTQELAQIGAVEAIQSFLIVDDIVTVPVKLGDDFGAGRALDVVLAHGALASRRQSIGLALRRVHRLPERRSHAFAADAGDAAIYQHDVNYGHLKTPRVIERGARVLDDAHCVLGLRRHGGDVHVEMAAVHVYGDDGRLGRLELELAVQTGDQARSVD